MPLGVLASLIGPLSLLLRVAAALLIATSAWAQVLPAGANSTLLDDGPNGVSSVYWNIAQGVKWRSLNGDWSDIDGVLNKLDPKTGAAIAGLKPWAVSAVLPARNSVTQPPLPYTIDVTNLFRDPRRDLGILILGGYPSRIASDEFADPVHRPRVVIVAGGMTYTREAIAAADLDRGVTAALGQRTTIQIDGSENLVCKAAMQFDLKGVPREIESATLHLTLVHHDMPSRHRVYRLEPPTATTPPRAAPGPASPSAPVDVPPPVSPSGPNRTGK